MAIAAKMIIALLIGDEEDVAWSVCHISFVPWSGGHPHSVAKTMRKDDGDTDEDSRAVNFHQLYHCRQHKDDTDADPQDAAHMVRVMPPSTGHVPAH